MNAFDELCALYEKTLLLNIASKLPPAPGLAEKWFDPTTLYWFGVSVDSYQDGRLYTAYSFGKVKDHHQLYRENLSRPEFDYDGLERVPMNEADEERYHQLRATIYGLAEEGDVDEGEEVDPEPPTLLALAVTIDKLRFPMPLAPTFSVSLSDDYETGTWPVTLASLSNASFDEWTEKRINRLWGDSPYAPLARHVWSRLDEKTLRLSDVVRAFRTP